MSTLAELLLGKSESTFTSYQQNYPGIRKEHKLQAEVLKDFLRLKEKASAAGFELAIVSSFRSYEAQEIIWNAKVKGERAVLDSEEKPLDIKTLTKPELVEAILRWSALPGASRHHWGTDIDIIDYNAIKGTDYKVQLTQSEASEEGPFGALHTWLDDQITDGESCFFYRPYALDLGGVSPEKWHLSHAGVSLALEDAYDFSFFEAHLERASFELAPVALSMAREIYERFVSATTPAPWG